MDNDRMTLEEYRRYKANEPAWLKEFDTLINDFFDVKNFYKQKEQETTEGEKL